MAVFGAPVAHEDHAERAVRAGLGILEAIEELNGADPGLELQVRVGINTGEAVVALGARPEQGEGIVTGDVVNTAARIQGAATLEVIGQDGVNPETWIYACFYNAPASHTVGEEDPIHDIATVTAKDEQDEPATDQDSHDTDLLHPNIHVVKRANASSALVGDTVTYTFTVTNTGDTPLGSITLSDAKCNAGTLSAPSGDGNGNGKLDTTETWTYTYTCTHLVTAGDSDPLHNVVTVSGKDGLNGSASDDDSLDVDVVHDPRVLHPGPELKVEAGTDCALQDRACKERSTDL